METAIMIILSILSSTALSSLIIFFINRKDNKQNDSKLIIEKLNKLEKGSTRTQLLLLINDIPQNESEILTVAEYYFKDLDGDWYMSAVFEEWMEKRNLSVPLWYNHK